ncbi:hypothetical protein Ddc_13221 [Ditylenchus destructor]|nr:hypothetical protein Ddc_13221 [Ditylenchus destructor]
MDNSGTAHVELVSPNRAAREEMEDGNDEAMEEEQVPEPENSLAKIAAQNAQSYSVVSLVVRTSTEETRPHITRFSVLSYCI